MRKNILYVEGCRDGTVGGSHTCLYSMIANLDMNRFSPAVVFYDDQSVAVKLRSRGVPTRIFKNEKPFNFELLASKRSPGLRKGLRVLLPLQKVANFCWFFLRPAFAYARYMSRHNVDILHLNNSLNTNHEWMLAAKLVGAKFISHERGISPHLSRTARILGGTADHIICVSRAIGDPLIAQGLAAHKLAVIYDGIDPSSITVKIAPEDLRAAYGIGRDAPVIGIVGNIKEWKGQETVVRATAVLKKTWPGIRCLLVGGFGLDDPHKAHLDRIVEELGLHEHVVFTGFQSNPADFMNIMNVVVHASILPEPFGMVNLEAMYMKKPVISTNIGGPTEIFEHGKDGLLIRPGEPMLLAEKIALLLKNQVLRETMGLKAYESVMKKFTMANSVRQIERIYERVVGR